MNFDDEEEWELCNDDGFVYKRKRRRLDPPPPPDQEPDREKRRRERKKQTLLKLKAKYEKEILQWESLSNTLSSMQQKSFQLQPPPPQPPDQTPSLPSSSDSAAGSLLDDLLSQVEFQEDIIHDISNLCDMAEAICDKREEQLKQSLFDLPIWGSPIELMQVLCECDD